MKPALVTALALGVSALSFPALADGPPAAPAPAAQAPSASPAMGTELSLRPTKPLELAPAQTSTSIGTKLLFALGAVGAIAFWLKRRQPAVAAAAPRLRVAARAPLGLRNEIVVVEVDGETFLLGVGPAGVQRIADLGTPHEAPAEETAPERERAVEERFERLLGGQRESTREARREDPRVAGQVEGLLALARGKRP